MNPYKKWADKIAKLLTKEELNELTALLDGDADNEFYHRLNGLNAKLNPDSYK